MAKENEKLAVEENPLKEAVKIDLTSEQKQELSQLIQDNWETSDAARVKWLRDKEEGLNLYWGIRKPKTFPFENCANLHVPLIRTIADTLHSNIMGSIDGNKPASAMPIGPEDVPKARKIEKTLNWQFTTQVDYIALVDKIVQSAGIFGIAPVKVRYVIEKRGSKKIFDGLKVDVIPPERFLMPPDSMDGDVDTMEYCIQEIPLSKSDLRKRMASKLYESIDKDDLDKIGEESSRASRGADDFLENLRGFYSGVDATEPSSPSKRYATLLEWYGAYDYNKDGIDELVMVAYLKEIRKVVRVVKWERERPFAVITMSEILHKPVGESVADLLKTLNQELNTLHNQDTDAATVRNIPFGFYDPVSGFDPQAIKLAPGTMIPVNGPPSQVVYFPSMNTASPDITRREEMLSLYAERMLGAGANAQGVIQPKRVSATEIAAVDRRSGIRFLTIFNRVRKGIRKIFKLALSLDREFMPPEIQVRITGLTMQKPVFETVRREDLEAQVDILINGNSILDEQAEKADAIQAYQVGITNPLIMRDEMALYELTRDLFIKLGIKRVDAYLRKPVDSIPKTPEEEHNLFMQEEDVEPNLMENMDDHLEKHSKLINSDNFKILSKRGQALLLKHYSDTSRMKNTLEQMELVAKMERVNQMLMHTQMTGQLPPEVLPPALAQQQMQPAKPSKPGRTNG